MRCFVAIETEKETHELIEQLQSNLRKLPGRFSFGNPKTAHITLTFLGEIDKSKSREIKTMLCELAKKHRTFTLKTTHVGVFPSKEHVRTVWLGIAPNDALLRIHEDLNRPNHNAKEQHPKFTPHITIARVNYVKDKRELKKVLDAVKKIDETKIVVREIKLKKSTITPQGPVYSDVGAYRLREKHE